MSTTISKASEQELRDMEVPTFQNEKDLMGYITTFSKRGHDYGTCVYAMSMAATATFNFIASKLGVTGFQASCADLDIVRRLRRLEGPFMLVKAEDALYPQYQINQKVSEFLDNSLLWLRKEARKKLKEVDSFISPDVFNRWVEYGYGPLNDEEIKEWNKQNPETPYNFEEDAKEVKGLKRKAFLLEGVRQSDVVQFVKDHVDELLQAGLTHTYTYANVPHVSLADDAEEGGSYRLGATVSLSFSKTIKGFKIHWGVGTETSGANGSSKYHFDWPLLNGLLEGATNERVKKVISGYIEKIKKLQDGKK